jgi:hypothetical protein
MEFVRHKKNDAWGLGAIAARDGNKVDVFFENAAYKKLSTDVDVLAVVDDVDVPRDHQLRKREDWPRIERDVRREIARRELPKKFDAFVREFFAYYPEGLRSERCDSTEREYKWKAVEYARKTLKLDELRDLLLAGNHIEVLLRARRVLGKTNLAFPNELMAFDDVPSAAQPSVAEKVVALVGAGDRMPDAVEALGDVLAPHGAAKWPVVSLIPFLLEPEKWPFVKPTAVERISAATSIDVEYAPKPNARTYRLVTDLYKAVAEILGERGFAPRDNIDVQTFLWIATGMAKESDEAKKK